MSSVDGKAPVGGHLDQIQPEIWAKRKGHVTLSQFRAQSRGYVLCHSHHSQLTSLALYVKLNA